VKSVAKTGRQVTVADRAAGSRAGRSEGAGRTKECVQAGRQCAVADRQQDRGQTDQGSWTDRRVRSGKRLVETRCRTQGKLVIGTRSSLRRRDNMAAGEATGKLLVGMQGRLRRRDNMAGRGDGEAVGRDAR
jgi:hypothetical protein